jgi:fermentation-respiration switch protein FrsA (DUF1100 family)
MKKRRDDAGAVESALQSQIANRKSKIQTWSWRLLRIAALVYLGLCLVFAYLQTKMIFPGAATQGQRHAVVRPSTQLAEELVELRASDGTKIVGLFGPALRADGTLLPPDERAAAPTLLYFYGNGMCLADCAGESRAFRKLGANVLVCDFAGYGMSGGEPGEAGVYATAHAAYDYVTARPDVNKSKIVPIGWSLGAAAAIELASTRPVAGLITLSAFSSMSDMARQLLPFMPTSLLLRHHFDNERKLRKVSCPALMFHGRDDQIIPFTMLARLDAALKSPHKTVPIDGAGHNDIFEVGAQPLLDEIDHFLRMQLK